MAIIKTKPVPPGADWGWDENWCSLPLEPETEYEATLDYPADGDEPACYRIDGDLDADPHEYTFVWISDDPSESYAAELIKE